MPGDRVAIVGVSGYLGGELARLLVDHPGLELVGAVSRSHAGRSLRQALPFLSDGNAIPVLADADTLDCDLAFLALPAGEALREVPHFRDRGIRVVDLSADYRLRDPGEYQRTYGRPHTDPDGLAHAVYGLTEANREAIRSARLVANPSCYPTAFLLGSRPLVDAGLHPSGFIVDAKSGSSGAGASPSPETHHPAVAGDVHPYGGGRHRHLPEMIQELHPGSSDVTPTVSFVPHLVPIVRGILASTYLLGLTSEESARATEIIGGRYASEPFVRYGPTPRIPWAVGSNCCYLGTESSGGNLVVFSAIDNLLKGGAGQAVQNANLMMGRPETEGLPLGGLGV
ncbi:MAG TPA: N-acetyl-gamma-glutamyl-phosphate reductase [Thermoplasmata archaeon]|nr:N-acetyl-gamma-glutamyl-phosphate reductase [Thermoplasmata archaeon]